MIQDRSRLNLRCRLKARAWSLLALFTKPLDRPLTVRAGDETHVVAITITPTGGKDGATDGAPSLHFPGNHFSPLEASIYHALADGPLVGKSIAARVSQEYDTCFRTILSNLVQRKALVHSKLGYGQPESTKR